MKPKKLTGMVEIPIELLNKIHCDDCLTFMEKLPDNSIDLIIFDPPYSRFSGSDGIQANIGDYKILEVYFKEISYSFKRILKNDGAVFGFCDFRTYPCLYYGMYYNFQPANLIIWKKDFIGPGINFRPLHELIVYWKNSDTPSPKDRNISDIWEEKRVRNKKHTYQKPIELVIRMIENCSNINDVIFDPFCGSGTTPHACKTLNRQFIGVEISPEYCKEGNIRVNGTFDNWNISNTME